MMSPAASYLEFPAALLRKRKTIMSEMASVPPRPPKRLKQLPREELALFVAENVKHLLEEEVLAVLDNPFVTPAVCQTIARNQRLTGFYSVRLKLVSLRQTPLSHAVK